MHPGKLFTCVNLEEPGLTVSALSTIFPPLDCKIAGSDTKIATTFPGTFDAQMHAAQIIVLPSQCVAQNFLTLPGFNAPPAFTDPGAALLISDRNGRGMIRCVADFESRLRRHVETKD